MRTIISALAATAGILAAAGSLSAQGSSVYVHGACMNGVAGAGVAAPCADATGIFYNPSALADHGGRLTAGVSGIFTGGSFTFDGPGGTTTRDNAFTPVPHAFASLRLDDRWAAGIGVFAPYGLGIEWPLEFEGRFVGYDNALQGLYIQPTVAWEALPEVLYVGAGLDIVRGSLEINQRVDLAGVALPGTPFTFGSLGVPAGTDFADASLVGSGWGATFHLGVMARLTDRVSVGGRYLHEARVRPEGTATFQPVETGLVLAANNPLGLPPGTPLDALLAGLFEEGGGLTDQAVATELRFPAQAVLGLAFRPLDQLNLLLDYQWTGWSSFNEFDIEFGQAEDVLLILDYEDASTLRIGADLEVSDALNLRGGFIYNTAATPDETVTPLLPEAERNYYTAGLGYRTGAWRVDLAYQFIDQADRRGRVVPRGSRDQTADTLNEGLYTTTGQVLGLTLTRSLGARER